MKRGRRSGRPRFRPASLARPTGLVLLASLYPASCLNAPTDAWCSLTKLIAVDEIALPGLNAPTGAWCSLTKLIAVDEIALPGLNAPTGAWCSLTEK